MLADAGNFVKTVDEAFIFITVISLFFLILVTVLMLFFVWKYNKKRNKKATNIHGHLGLEIAWTLIPTILVLFMFWFGWVGYKEMTDVPKEHMVVEVTAQMWKWNFKYDNNIQTDTLYVPLNKNIRLNLNSIDVNHAFFVPAFRLKKDVIPGRKNYIWFRADEVGSYDIACAEYCGLNHSYMYSKVVVMPEQDYTNYMQSLVDAERQKAGADSTQVLPDSLKQKNNEKS